METKIRLFCYCFLSDPCPVSCFPVIAALRRKYLNAVGSIASVGSGQTVSSSRMGRYYSLLPKKDATDFPWLLAVIREGGKMERTTHPPIIQGKRRPENPDDRQRLCLRTCRICCTVPKQTRWALWEPNPLRREEETGKRSSKRGGKRRNEGPVRTSLDLA